MSLHILNMRTISSQKLHEIRKMIKCRSSRIQISADVESGEVQVLGISEDTMKLNGSKYAVRKVYIRTADSGDYYKVGWILNQDIDECMICRKTFGNSYNIYVYS